MHYHYQPGDRIADPSADADVGVKITGDSRIARTLGRSVNHNRWGLSLDDSTKERSALYGAIARGIANIIASPPESQKPKNFLVICVAI